MKFLIDATEIKKILKTVKKVFSIYASKESVQRVCLLQGDPEKKTITLEFCSSEAFIEHTFVDVEFMGQDLSFKRSVDLSSLAELSFSEPLVELSLSENKIYFRNGGLSGTLLVSSIDMEKVIEKARLPSDWFYPYSFKVASFLEAMDAHSYGKHTDSAALERPVRFYANKGRNVFLSQDKIAACFLKKDEGVDAADLLFYPVTMTQILKTFDKSPGVFTYNESETHWGIHYDRTRLWGPRVSARPPKQDIMQIVRAVRDAEGYAVSVKASDFSKHLSAIKPFFEGTDLKDKDSAPFVTLCFQTGTKLQLQVANRRALDVHKEVDVDYIGALPEPKDQSFVLNYDFMVEFLSALIKNSEDKNCMLEIRWWPYGDDKYPTKGRAVSFSVEHNFYIVSRVSLRKGLAL